MDGESPSLWRNVASAPSHSRDRGLIATQDILGKLDVPKCAQVSVASKIAFRRGYETGLVSGQGVETLNFSYPAEMNMSFAKDGHDYVSMVVAAPYEPFVAEIYRYQCDNVAGTIAYMPKCQNIAALGAPRFGGYRYPYPWGATHGGGVGGYGTYGTTSHTIPEPSILLLLGVGVLAFFFSTRGKYGRSVSTRRSVGRRNRRNFGHHQEGGGVDREEGAAEAEGSCPYKKERGDQPRP